MAELSAAYCHRSLTYFLFQVARRTASSRRPSCSFPPHESASFLHASASSYRPVWDYLSTILTSSPSLLAPSLLPSDHLACAWAACPAALSEPSPIHALGNRRVPQKERKASQ